MRRSTIQPQRRRSAFRRGLAGTVAGVMALTGVGLAPAVATAAELPAPTAHYDMSHSGSQLLDVSGNARHATLTGLTSASFADAGGDDVLRFRADGYAALPKGLVTGTDNNFTVEFTVAAQTAQNSFGWVIGDGVGPWNTTQLGNHIFLSPRSAQGGYTNQVLAAIRVKTDGNNGESRMPAGGGLNAGFTTLTMVGSGNTLTLYRDGAVISTLTHNRAMSSIIPAGDTLGYIGRSLYQGDSLLRADVSDMKFWDVALTPEEVTASMPDTEEKTAATAALLRGEVLASMLGANPSLDSVTSNLTLGASVNGVNLTWASSNPAVISTTGVVSRAITENTPVTLTATTSLGSTLTFDATVIAPTVGADLDAIVLEERTTENLPLAVKGSVNGADITWESSDPELVTATDPDYVAPAVGAADPFEGGGLVTRPAYGEGDREVTLTATATLNGQTATRTFTLDVAEKARTAPDEGYVAAYFKSDSDERIYQAATSGNDFFSFAPVNGGQPTVENTADTTGLRDPYILRSAEGDKYYMIATDLCIGCGTGWGPAQSDGSLKVHIWESTDLVNWERTNDENSGITVNQPAAGMTWAPEAYWDDELQSYVLFFASRLYSDASKSNSDNLYARMFYVLTRDFRTFTYPPQSWQDTGYARIDSTVIKIDDFYYRFTKNEEGGAADGLEAGKDIFLEKSQVLTAPTTRSNWSADPAQTWQLTDTRMTTLETNQAGEGPQVIKLNEGDPSNTGDGYVFLVDNYGDGGYRAFVTTGDEIASSSQADRLSQRSSWVVRQRGGLPASPRHGSFVNVSGQVLDAVNSWSDVEAVASTTALDADGRELTASVTAEDEGDVVGTVTFAGGEWSETVALVDGTATATAPAGVTAVTATYDGYRDGLVATSVSDEVDIAGLAVTATAITRCLAGKVLESVTIANDADAAATVVIQSRYGSKTFVLAPGKKATHTFTTRTAAYTAGVIEVSASTADGRSVQTEVSLAARSCN
ncbi:immunoglobulin-like domain-containing protein [Microbacterium aurantiacum]|uniref:immunoglobulin-like domain-containing protein n=1 Tax=Microbacterium aurantiacum TaxID=162393 RepID=UPI001F3865B0|nr:immunoglobulin-like domain-containing protein [Microbacterium aurantiacum]